MTGRRAVGALTAAGTAAGVAAGALLVGYLASAWAGGTLHTTMLPWIAGRGLGLAAYLALVGLVATGLWLRHPLRLRLRRPGPLPLLWTHASLAAGATVLVTGHVVALALDRYAGVGWTGAFVPGASGYRPVGVALGTLGLYVGALAAAAVLLAGRLVGTRWLAVHRLGSAAFTAVWLHGLLAGSDAAALRPFYLLTGGLVAVLALSRHVLPQPLAMREGPT